MSTVITGNCLRTGSRLPDSLLDRAFGSALTTLEYTWVDPYGWVECIHHWTSLWHMQQNCGGRGGSGQTDRSRATTLKQAGRDDQFRRVDPAFRAVRFYASRFRRDEPVLGMAGARYWNFTGDLDFAAATAPVLDRVIGQTFAEYDRNDNLLLGWGLQIGNQEDYVATAGDGTTPSVEGINMMRTRSELAAGLGDTTASAAVARPRRRDRLAAAREIVAFRSRAVRLFRRSAGQSPGSTDSTIR